MSLQLGSRLGPYEVTALLGVGGMGEVYRATDTNLKRAVAIKVLPESLAKDPERLARFQREAEVLASLNHPNIAQIYGLERSNGLTALVMELVEGPTLADRIANGPLPVDDALPIAKQIVEALEAAHEREIIHRDLKPANIKVRSDGTVKVLDFGLAKVLEPMSTTGATISSLPTVASPANMTSVGTLLGTAAYMAPEQAKGHPADKRSDIWALGCVLFEMIAGRRAFDGDDVATVLAQVIEREPRWSELPAAVPSRLRELVRLCLEKNPKRRRQAAGDIRIDLEQVLMEPVAAPPQVVIAGERSRRIWMLMTASIIVATVAGGVVWFATRPGPPSVTRFTLAPLGAEVLSISNIDRDLVLTPDGRYVVYRANNGTALFVRALDALQGTSLATGEIRSPFVSPDGRWVGFTDGTSTLKKVALGGGPVVTIASTEGSNSRGIVWLEDDTVIFATTAPGAGLQRVSSAGGDVTVLTRPDHARGETDHWWPEALPGGQAILYTITTSGGPDNMQIAVLDLASGTSKVVLRGGSHAVYVPTGHLLYTAGGTLLAVAFDSTRQETRGTPVPVLPRLVTTSYGAANVTVAGATGTLAYADAPGATVAVGSRSMVWVDRQGREEPVAAPPRAYAYPRLSPDGSRVAVSAADQEQDIWTWDLTRQTLTRFTFDPAFESFPEWTPDGRRLLFESRRTGSGDIYLQAADGSGAPERLTQGTFQRSPSGLSPDGRQLLLTEVGDDTGWNQLVMALDGTQVVTPVIKTRFNEGIGVISPDGRWLAYQANDTGAFEIYVRPWPNVDEGKWQISTVGGTRALWGRDSRELFYLGTGGSLWRVGVEKSASWTATPPAKLFEGPYLIGGSPARTFDISLDGRRFLMIREGVSGRDAAPPQIVVVQNWLDELKRLVPTN